MKRLLTDIDKLGCATLTLNNPQQHNAFDDRLIAELTMALRELRENPQVRVILLAANGRSFSAGADLNWMRRMADYSPEENVQDALALAELMRTLNETPQPTIALVQGAAFGGGVGLVAACDIAIASERSSFCLSEVRLGLIPAVISPYVLMAIGQRQARRYILTAERFSAAEALRIGLVHQVCAEADLARTATELCRQLLQNGPQALNEAKRLIREVAGRNVDSGLLEMTAVRIATIRASVEGREGLSAFLAKQQPSWFKE
ncbi:MAG: enoyl-CoA hydratase/isomerase family protein [Desulfuromonadales bacterium]|nr:enoyl-CoA hydratase/isomerase family protein [Desulfuromonadales bacterium]